MVDVPVNPDVLIWARKERHLTKQDAADRIGVSIEDLEKLESGEEKPNIGLLNKIATHYKIQVASLLMPEPLPAVTRPEIHDFRTVGGQRAKYGIDLVLAIEEVAETADALADLREMEPGTYPAPEVPKYTTTTSPIDVAAAERERLKITTQEQFDWDSDRYSFMRWREMIEGLGIHVNVRRLGDFQDVRGLSHWDERGVGIIVINNDEGDYRYRNFSLLHEYCHILLRMCGVSNENRQSKIERYCNQFAAFFLMPTKEFKREARAIHKLNAPWKEYHVNRLATKFHVSKSAVAIHMQEVDLVGPHFYETLRRQWQVRTPKKRSGGGTGSPAEKNANRLGGKTVRTVANAIQRGHLSKLDAYEILNVRPAHFSALVEEVGQRKAKYGGAGQG